jgi:Anthrone oxygenase
MISVLLEIIATLATGLFTGAAVYISLVEHPARVACGPAVAVRQFRPSYRRAAVMQASLALIGTLAALARFAVGGHGAWLGGGLLLGSVIPFTLAVIMPTNKRLLDESLDPASADVSALLGRWGRLHAMRSVTSLVAFIIFLTLLPRG